MKGKRITLSLETNGNDLNDCTLVTWAGEINNFVVDFSETKILSTTIQPDVTDWSIRIKLKSGQTYNNILYKIMVTFGEYAGSLYIPYEGMTYPAAVGETIEVEQYDGVTNIISITAGAAVSTQFLQSTRYELDTKPVSLAGTYAERPTGTYPYVVLYTATDRSGETYRLEANADGSVSANWVKINGMYQHNIVISPDGLTYFSVTLFSVEDYKYSLNNLVKWLDQKGFNANGKDYTNVSGIIKPESEVLIVSHIKVLDGNLTVAASSAVTGNISENTISTVVALNDTVI